MIETVEAIYKKMFAKKKKYKENTEFYSEIIFKYEVVSKYDFYGYHAQREKFLKIYLYDERMLKPLTKIFQSGILMNIQF